MSALAQSQTPRAYRMPRRITIELHLSLEELERRYRQAKEPVRRTHFPCRKTWSKMQLSLPALYPGTLTEYRCSAGRRREEVKWLWLYGSVSVGGYR